MLKGQIQEFYEESKLLLDRFEEIDRENNHHVILYHLNALYKKLCSLQDLTQQKIIRNWYIERKNDE